MTFFNKAKRLLVPVLAATFYITSASAATLFDNGLPNTVNGYSILGSSETRDDFTLQNGGTITHVTFYFQNYNGITDWNQDVTYNIWDARVGGNLLATGAGLNVTPVDSGLPWCCGGGNAWTVDFDLSAGFVAAPGQTYWLGLTGATGSGSAWWVTADTVNGNSSVDGQVLDIDFAFSLSDDGDPPVPPIPAEPVPAANTLALAILILLLATAGFITMRRYQG